ANSDCKSLLKSLPNKKPSHVEMIEACNRFGTAEHKYETMAAAFAAMNTGGTSAVCFGCGKPGHIKKNCLVSKG
ncbi:POK9 protein, partial [Ramphastos sulfuratus]|nr:POK9 protein [Ramphastos sulfuratus]